MSTDVVTSPSAHRADVVKGEKRKRPPKEKAGLILQYAIILFAVAIFMLPFVYLFFTSLKPRYEVFTVPPKLIGSKIMWSNYVEVFTYGPFLRYILNSIFVAVCGTALVVVVSVLAGYAFGRLRWKGRDVVFLLFLGTLMIPAEVIVVPMFILMQQFGWVDTYKSLIFPFAFTAFGTFLMRQFYRSIPYELDEAAKVDGAGPIRIFLQIILPLAKSSLAVLAVFTFLTFWNSYLWPLITIVDFEARGTIPLGLAMFSTQFGTRWDLQTAATVVSMIPSVIIVVALQKHLIKGIATVGLGGR